MLRGHRLNLLYFLDYQLDDPLPWHSTVSRTRKLYPEALFEMLFDKVFSLCVEKDMVAGSTQAVDSALVKANASMESLVLKQGAASAENRLQKAGAEHQDVNKEENLSCGQYITAPDHQLRRLARRQQRLSEHPTGAIGASNEKAQLLSNKPPYSPHDPDARISVKPGKARQLNYHCSKVVDTAKGVISHIRADFADGRDSQHLPSLVMRYKAG